MFKGDLNRICCKGTNFTNSNFEYAELFGSNFENAILNNVNIGLFEMVIIK